MAAGCHVTGSHGAGTYHGALAALLMSLDSRWMDMRRQVSKSGFSCVVQYVFDVCWFVASDVVLWLSLSEKLIAAYHKASIGNDFGLWVVHPHNACNLQVSHGAALVVSHLRVFGCQHLQGMHTVCACSCSHQ